MENRKSFFDFKICIGVLILLFGFLLLLRNMGYMHGVRIWEYWPILLILVGLRLLIRPNEYRQPVSGLFLTIIGAIFLLNNLDVIDLRWGLIWPLLLIFLGVVIIYHSLWRKRGKSSGQDNIDLSMIFGGGEFRYDSKAIKGGNITAIMGGGSIDLRDADFADSEISLDLFALMGGIELFVPRHWTVVVHATPILGGVENKAISSTQPTDTHGKRLLLHGTVIMGGIDIKN